MKETRRAFLKKGFASCLTFAALAKMGTCSAAEKQPKGQTGAILLGGPSFSKATDPEELALAHRQLGYSAAFCPHIAITDAARIRATENAFAKYDVVLAEVGRWVNLLDADPEKRRKNLETVTEGLALADAVGARCCVDIAGSYSPTSWFGPHPDNLTKKHFDATVENARKIIDAVKPTRAKFCFEMMGWAYPDSAESCLKLLRAVDRKAFAVHLDPCNLVQSPERFYRNSELINECFDKLGAWIVSCHAKDLTWEVEMNIHFREVQPGKGVIDYKTYLRRLARLPQRPPLMLEHLNTPEEYAEARDYIVGVGRQLGSAL